MLRSNLKRAFVFFLEIQVLKWARTNGCAWDEEVCASAASGGHLDVLMYCWANRCPWNEYTCKLAAEGGHLEVLKWCRSKGCPWDEDVCAFAADEGHIEVCPSLAQNDLPGMMSSLISLLSNEDGCRYSGDVMWPLR